MRKLTGPGVILYGKEGCFVRLHTSKNTKARWTERLQRL